MYKKIKKTIRAFTKRTDLFIRTRKKKKSHEPAPLKLELSLITPAAFGKIGIIHKPFYVSSFHANC
jgi:hypothetical protein